MSDSNAFSITIQAQATTQLSQAAQGIPNAGQSVVFNTAPNWVYPQSISWMTSTLYYDPIRKLVHVMGKQHNGLYEHFIYDEQANSGAGAWSPDRYTDATGSGHVWNHAFSREHGEYYFVISGTQDIQRWIPGSGTTGTWTTTTLSGYGGGSGHAGMGWHPNLFGAGDGGVVVNAQTALVAWQRRTGDWHVLQSGLSDPGYNGGCGAYNSVSGKLWVGTGNIGRTRSIATGSGGTTPGAVTNLNNPPVLIHGGGSSLENDDTSHKVIPHPYTAGRMILLSMRNPRCYYSDNDGASWTPGPDPTWDHPFPTGDYTTLAGQWTCGPIPEYGVIWGGVASYDTSIARLWRPPT